jgi:hypothetical protein
MELLLSGARHFGTLFHRYRRSLIAKTTLRSWGAKVSRAVFAISSITVVLPCRCFSLSRRCIRACVRCPLVDKIPGQTPNRHRTNLSRRL